MYDLGLSDDLFWRLSPRDFSLLLRRMSQEQEQQNRRVARICAAIYNAPYIDIKRRGGKPYTENDFMPKQRRPQGPEQMLETVKALNKLYGGVGGE